MRLKRAHRAAGDIPHLHSGQTIARSRRPGARWVRKAISGRDPQGFVVSENASSFGSNL